MTESTKDAKPCVYDTNHDGDCHHCALRGGCQAIGGQFATIAETFKPQRMRFCGSSEWLTRCLLRLLRKRNVAL